MTIDTRCCLNWALVNIQSAGNKTYEIRDYINENKLDSLKLKPHPHDHTVSTDKSQKSVC